MPVDRDALRASFALVAHLASNSNNLNAAEEEKIVALLSTLLSLHPEGFQAATEFIGLEYFGGLWEDLNGSLPIRNFMLELLNDAQASSSQKFALLKQLGACPCNQGRDDISRWLAQREIALLSSLPNFQVEVEMEWLLERAVSIAPALVLEIILPQLTEQEPNLPSLLWFRFIRCFLEETDTIGTSAAVAHVIHQCLKTALNQMPVLSADPTQQHAAKRLVWLCLETKNDSLYGTLFAKMRLAAVDDRHAWKTMLNLVGALVEVSADISADSKVLFHQGLCDMLADVLVGRSGAGPCRCLEDPEAADCPLLDPKNRETIAGVVRVVGKLEPLKGSSARNHAYSSVECLAIALATDLRALPDFDSTMHWLLEVVIIDSLASLQFGAGSTRDAERSVAELKKRVKSCLVCGATTTLDRLLDVLATGTIPVYHTAALIPYIASEIETVQDEKFKTAFHKFAKVTLERFGDALDAGRLRITELQRFQCPDWPEEIEECIRGCAKVGQFLKGRELSFRLRGRLTNRKHVEQALAAMPQGATARLTWRTDGKDSATRALVIKRVARTEWNNLFNLTTDINNGKVYLRSLGPVAVQILGEEGFRVVREKIHADAPRQWLARGMKRKKIALSESSGSELDLEPEDKSKRLRQGVTCKEED
ncbi:hypothetical protein HMN09_00785300 [Mycena chlorophos]|uniref:Uncharacterized protein n=1 Tax=Mycena chlorophos TaxID=658473 RepID=A0A8H6WAJ1_MYCCL|nr:hypothetical protein HMN09_00785300 [Mycena chlorophos]